MTKAEREKGREIKAKVERRMLTEEATPREWTPGEWTTSRDAVPPGHVQITVYAETGGRGTRVATVFDREANARLIRAAPELVEALKEISERGPVEGYGSAGALHLRLVATQSIARAALSKLND